MPLQSSPSFSSLPRLLVTVVGIVTFATAGAHAQSSADSAAIRQAALDYIEGYYTGNADRMMRAVAPELVKRIVVRDTVYRHEWISGMGASQLIEGTRAGFGTRSSADKKRWNVSILDIAFERAAVAKVVVPDWVDYLQLARVDGQWKIVNVLWERTPR
ncbi:MAG: nuclear transport factor 2 family protein [Gemmatimonadetes bacterium]|nr:nuclear transport factor 2 family protein [Gemmatimonadota bacterium]